MKQSPVNLFFGLMAILAFSILFSTCQKEQYDEKNQSVSELRIGALLALSGDGSLFGTSAAVSIRLGQQDINAWLNAISKEVTVSVTIVDTRTDTAVALEQLRNFYQKGIKYIVGPTTSAELAALKPFADSHGMILVSPSSIAASLAIPNDNIFRFVTSDLMQGQAMSALLLEDSVKAIIPVVRNDVWGNDLIEATTAAFTARGGMVMPVLHYAPDALNYAALLTSADSLAGTLLTSYQSSQIAVYLCSFNEGTGLLKEASNWHNLGLISWYGSSAYAQNPSALFDTTVASFASTRNLPCPTFGLDEACRDKWEPLKNRIKSVTGTNPEVYSLVAYDAVWVGIKTLLLTGINVEIATFKSAFVTEAGNYWGVTGNCELDINGDRKTGNYDFWAIRRNSSGFYWKVLATYNSATGYITRIL